MAGKMVHCAEGHFCGTGKQCAFPRHAATFAEGKCLGEVQRRLVNTPVQAGPSEMMEIGASRLVPVPFRTGKYPL